MHRPIRTLVAINVFAIALFSTPAVGEPCALEEGPYGNYIGDCLIEEFTAKAAVVVRTPRIQLQLPNLRFHEVDVSVTGIVSVEVANDGTVDAPAYQVVVGAYLEDLDGSNVDSFETVVQFPPLASGARYQTSVGTLSVPNDNQNRDVTVAVLVDAMSIVNPGGQIWESNEQDNFGEHVCRIYGDPPDYDGPSGC